MPGFPQTLPCLNSDFTLSKLRLYPILSASDMTAFLEFGVHTSFLTPCAHHVHTDKYIKKPPPKREHRFYPSAIVALL